MTPKRALALLVVTVTATALFACAPDAGRAPAKNGAGVGRTGAGRSTGDSAAPSTPSACMPTRDDGVSPTYQPGAPRRSVVGSGHVLLGRVVSGRGCDAIAGARIELWPEYADEGHPDAARATVFTAEDGEFRFECDPPEHIHMRASATGYRTIGINSYHPDGSATGTIEIVLWPAD